MSQPFLRVLYITTLNYSSRFLSRVLLHFDFYCFALMDFIYEALYFKMSANFFDFKQPNSSEIVLSLEVFLA